MVSRATQQPQRNTIRSHLGKAIGTIRVLGQRRPRRRRVAFPMPGQEADEQVVLQRPVVVSLRGRVLANAQLHQALVVVVVVGVVVVP